MTRNRQFKMEYHEFGITINFSSYLRLGFERVHQFSSTVCMLIKLLMGFFDLYGKTMNGRTVHGEFHNDL